MTYRLTFRAAPTGPIPPQRRQPGRNGAPDSPIRDDFPDGPVGADAYVLAWNIWLQQQADGMLTRAERRVRAELYAELFDVPYEIAERFDLSRLRLLSLMHPEVKAAAIAALVTDGR
jgi:hypothetical protein